MNEWVAEGVATLDFLINVWISGCELFWTGGKQAWNQSASTACKEGMRPLVPIAFQQWKSNRAKSVIISHRACTT